MAVGLQAVLSPELPQGSRKEWLPSDGCRAAGSLVPPELRQGLPAHSREARGCGALVHAASQEGHWPRPHLLGAESLRPRRPCAVLTIISAAAQERAAGAAGPKGCMR